MVVVSLLLAHAQAGECPEVASNAQVLELLTQAEAAFARLEIEVFLQHSDTLRATAPCLGEVIEPALAAHWFRIEGLRLFGDRSVDTVRAFAAARALEPDYRFPEALAPPNSRILEDYLLMSTSAAEPAALPEPVEGTLYIDGTASRMRATAWPALIQLVGDDGTPIWSAYVAHEDPIPAYAAVPEPVQVVDSLIDTPVVLPPQRSELPLWIATGSAAAATITLYGVAAATRATYMDPATPDESLPGLRARTNTLVVVSGISGAAALGLGTAVVIPW